MGRAERPVVPAVRTCPRDGAAFDVHLEGAEKIYRCPVCWWTERQSQGSGLILPPRVQPSPEFETADDKEKD